MSDLRHQLRVKGFPHCVKDAIYIVGNILNTNSPLAADIVSEFIFCEKTSKPMNSIDELEVLVVLSNHLSQASLPQLRNTLFWFLFPTDNSLRLPFLCKLVSMAVATRASLVLSSTASWIEQNFLKSRYTPCLTLARNLVHDYLQLVPATAEQLKELPMLAPEFAAIFLSTLTELYTSKDKHSMPPPSLLEIVAFWLSKSPEICTTGSALIPFPGLARWTLTAPLHGVTTFEPYSQIHLALIESVLLTSGQTLLTTNQMLSLIAQIQSVLPNAQPEQKEQSINRFVQMIIVLLSHKKIIGNIDDVYRCMETLPKNELLSCFDKYRKDHLSFGRYVR